MMKLNQYPESNLGFDEIIFKKKFSDIENGLK